MRHPTNINANCRVAEGMRKLDTYDSDSFGIPFKAFSGREELGVGSIWNIGREERGGGVNLDL